MKGKFLNREARNERLQVKYHGCWQPGLLGGTNRKVRQVEKGNEKKNTKDERKFAGITGRGLTRVLKEKNEKKLGPG